MKRFFIAALFSLWSPLAFAGINCPLPFTLTNGTTADASQVMANYNALVTCLTRAAAAGANTDITSLIGLTTPLAPSEGGSFSFTTGAGASTGSGNAQVVATATPNGFSLTAGNIIYFIAGFSNSGPTTLAVNGTTATNVVTHTSTGLSSLAGGEIIAGQATVAYYDGTQFQLIDASPASSLVQPCTETSYHGVVIPAGYLAENGQAVSRTAFPNLFSCIAYGSVSATTNGTTTVTVPNSALFQTGWFVGGNNVPCNSQINSIPGGGTTIVLNNSASGSGATTLTIGPYPQGDCSTTFNVPNANGRATVGIDTTGGHMSSVACPNPASVGSTCGSLTQTIPLANLPSIPSTGTTTFGGKNVGTYTSPAATTVSAPTGSVNVLADTSGAGGLGSLGSAPNTATSTGTNGTAFLLQPVVLALKAIKF